MNEKKTLLVIEDEAVNRKILNKLLCAEYDIMEASNGQEGWDILQEMHDSISGILLDVVMPVMDGYQFLAKLQAVGIHDIPIIVTTGASDTESERKALAAGAWDFVTKPYNAQSILGRLKNAIARSEVVLYQQLQELAAHDPLTGLDNRATMFEETRRLLKKQHGIPFVFVRLDIDHFALFNTSFGESAGDALLRFFANSISELAAAHAPSVCGRMSGDVFCACIAYDGGEAGLSAEVAALQKKLAAYKKDYLLALSVGACVVTDHTLSVDDLYFRATMAAHNCKNQYENHLSFYDEAAGKKIAVSVAIANEMQTALDEQQFVVYLQPKFRVSEETICGAEALVRWKHPTKGMISPGTFIPVFENNGFITKLDYYVWDKTAAMLRKWMDEGKRPYPISVNISRISLYNPNLVALLTALVEKYQIPAYLLELEITESAYMCDPELMEATMRAFHKAGFTILMDDFGSGYSSLNTLKRIYIDILKIDMKFLPVEGEQERGEIILACIIKMANLLGMSVITEGVETRRQRDFLENTGCDCIQGYYYSRPIPQEEYEAKYIAVAPLLSAPPATARPGKKTPRRNQTVLVIDDAEDERVLLQQNLQELYHVHLCSSAEEALDYLEINKSRVKLILVDNVMPGMTGLEFLRYCHEKTGLCDIPQIMITANDTVEDQVSAFSAGAYDYIAKPLTREILLARVGHVMAVGSQTFAGVSAVGRN